MKKLDEFINSNFISLVDVNEDFSKILENLNGQKINECCGCCCDPCCSDKKCCDSYYPNYYSESEIVSILRNTPKVQTLFDIHYQFSNRYRYPGVSMEELKEPLFFRGCSYTIDNSYQSGEPRTTILMSTNAIANEKLYNFIKSLIDDFDFTYPTVLETEGKLQLFFIKGEGGYDEQEKTIKNGLEDVAKILGKLENKDAVTWSQVLDVSIDNVNNCYNFLVTCTIDVTKFQMTTEDFKKLQKKFETNKK